MAIATATLQGLYEQMLLIRVFETEAERQYKAARIGGYCQPQQLPARMLQDQKPVEQPKRHRRRDKHVHGDDAVRMIAKKGLPARRGRPSFPGHVLGHGGLADIDTELEQLTITRGAPHNGLAMLISRISARASSDAFGRPPRGRDFQRQ